MRVRKTFVTLAAITGLVTAAAPALAQFNVATVADQPAATLLLHYFEVDLANPAGANTYFTINNASATAALGHVTVWSAMHVPVYTFDVYLTAIFGVLGYFLNKWRCEPAPLILAFVLGPMMEEYFRRSMLVARGDLMIFVNHPISLAMLVATALLLLSICFPFIQKFRQKAFAE